MVSRTFHSRHPFPPMGRSHGFAFSLGFAATSLMLLCYALEDRSTWFILDLRQLRASGVYAFLQGAWPLGVVEVVFTIVALRRWRQRTRSVAA